MTINYYRQNIILLQITNSTLRNLYFLLQDITRNSFQLQSRVLALEFWLQEEDFVQGQVVVKCVAEITGVYREETASYIISKHKAPHKVNRGTLADSWLYLKI